MYAIRSYYVKMEISAQPPVSMSSRVIWPAFFVITSYSIHYTKLYDILGALLLFGSMILVATNFTGITELNIFAATLAVQALPFLSAWALATIERRASDRAARAAAAAQRA